MIKEQSPSAKNQIQRLLEEQKTPPGRTIRVVILMGPIMVLAGCILMTVGVAFAFSITLMVWGSILAAMSIWLRARGFRAQVEQTRLLCALQERSMQIDQRSVFAEKLWVDGLPTECSIADVLVLLDAHMGSRAGFDTDERTRTSDLFLRKEAFFR